MRYVTRYGHYELNPFPGNASICVSNHAFIRPENRGKGYGIQQHERRLRHARMLGYSFIMCTVRKDNEREKHILSTHGWGLLSNLNNAETGDEIELYGRVL
jgi:predicted acetyltransferase